MLLASFLDGVQFVESATDRNTRFPTPSVNQKVYNPGDGYVQRYTGGAWVNEIAFASATGGQTFTGGNVPNPTTFSSTSTFGAGIQISGPNFSPSGTIDIITNSARTNRASSISLNGPLSDGSQDVALVNLGLGAFQVDCMQQASLGVTPSLMTVAGSLTVLGTQIALYGSTFINNANRANVPSLLTLFGGNSAGVLDIQVGGDTSGNFTVLNSSGVSILSIAQTGSAQFLGSITGNSTLTISGIAAFASGAILGAISTTIAPASNDSSTNIPTTAWVQALLAGTSTGIANPLVINQGRSSGTVTLQLAAASSANDVTVQTDGTTGALTFTGATQGMLTLHPTTGTVLNYGPSINHAFTAISGSSIWIDLNISRLQTTANVAIRFKGASSDGIFGMDAATNQWNWITGSGTVLSVTSAGNMTVAGTATITGNITFPTQTAGDNTTKGATTAFVTAAIAAAGSGTAANPLLVNAARAATSATLNLAAASSGNDITLVNANNGTFTMTCAGNMNLVVPSAAGSTLNYGPAINHPNNTIAAASIYLDLNSSRLQTTGAVGIRLKGASADGILAMAPATNLLAWITTNGNVFTVDVTGNLTVLGGGSFAAAVTGLTATFGDSTTKLATTAFVQAAVSAVSGGGISNPLIVNSSRGSSTAAMVLQGSASTNDSTITNNGTTLAIQLGSAGTLFSVTNGNGSYLQNGYSVDNPYSGTNWSQWNKSRNVTTGTYSLEVLGASTSQDMYFTFNHATGAIGIATGGAVGAQQWIMDSSGNITTLGNLNTSGPVNMNIASGNVYQVLNAARTTGGTQLQFLASTSANDIQFVTQNNGTAYFASNTNPIFSMKANGISVSTGATYQVNLTQVVTARQTGWAAATGTATRTSFATSSVTLPQLAQAVKAIIDDLFTHGLIGT